LTQTRASATFIIGPGAVFLTLNYAFHTFERDSRILNPGSSSDRPISTDLLVWVAGLSENTDHVRVQVSAHAHTHVRTRAHAHAHTHTHTRGTSPCHRRRVLTETVRYYSAASALKSGCAGRESRGTTEGGAGSSWLWMAAALPHSLDLRGWRLRARRDQAHLRPSEASLERRLRLPERPHHAEALTLRR
jgi:hypothetical protein